MQKIQFRASAELEGNKLSGIAHSFGERAEVNGHLEELDPHVFDKAMEYSDPRATVQHDPAKLLGRLSNGTLKVEVKEVEGKKVLAYEIDLPDTTYANDLKELINRGDLNEMSFGFVPGTLKRSRTADGRTLITHTSAKELMDISPVSIPAFGGTSIQVHSKSYENESLQSQIIRAKAHARKRS